ncbi:23059_t:CDS:2 [Gigaspora margarita]|uniref:23059_t:CDS:1 n=1 Tax=Gigaspora margarita TaxID=4874 RepID=A0ABN7VJ59_GIGMA|nr:23059_t:CDS:2 [Gigaspora margarita]
MSPFKNYIFLWLTIILVWMSAGSGGFAPPGRFRENSALVGNRLYFFGSQNTAQQRDNIYLDVTLSTLNTTNPSWFRSNSIPADFLLASSCVGGPNKNTIYLLNHLTTSNGDSNNTIVYAFDTVATSWSTPNISGQIPLSRQQFQAVNDTNGKIYMFGGFKYPNPSFDVIFNDIYILDTLILTWIQGSNVNAPTPRVDFTATLLNNGFILYLGGIAGVVGTNTIYMSEFATGDTLNSRYSHTAVLSPDGHVIIYGGVIIGSTDQSQVLASLDSTVNPYKWSIKPIIGNNLPPSLAFHSSNIVGSFMILTFGVMMANNTFSNLNNVNSKIYLLDTRNYTWVTSTSTSLNSSHPPNPTVTQIQTVIASDSNLLSTGTIVTIPLVLIAILAIAGFTGYWFYKKKKQNDIIRVAGSKFDASM